MTTLRVNEVYDRLTVQGEGPHTGRVCTFVRTYGCNLHCRWCDTAYTWDTLGRNGTVYRASDESHVMNVDAVAAAVVATGAPLCVISGGEPLTQATAVVDLAHQLAVAGVEVHVETNGTRPPPREQVIAHYSVSPKLASADAGPEHLVLPLASLQAWAEHPRACWKVVVATPDEVDQAVDLFDQFAVPADMRWVMPQASTEGALCVALGVVVDRALQHRLNVSNRLHVALWGAQRGK